MRKVIATSAAPAAVGPYSQAIKTERLVFTAGQLGLDPVAGKFAGADITAQTQQAMQNLQAVIQAAGSDMEHVLKTTIYMVDLADFKTAVMRWLELKRHSPDLIANAGDQVPPGAVEDRIHIMRDLVERYGRY